MKLIETRLHRFVLALILTLLPFAFLFLIFSAEAQSATIITIEDEIIVPDVKRLGVNVGKRNQFGAAQYLKNVIDNPGFESGEFATIFLVAPDATGQRIQQDNWSTDWNNDEFLVGQPEGFWDGAEYEIVSGPAKGRTGTISRFTHEDGLYTYYLDKDGTPPEAEDVVFLRHERPGFAGRPNVYDHVQADTTDKRPGSPGQQSLQLLPAADEEGVPYIFYMDSIWKDADISAGKLFIIEGTWHFEIWAKGSEEGDTLTVSFDRAQEDLPFFTHVISLTTSWEKYEYETFVPPGTDRIWDTTRTGNAPLQIKLEIGDSINPVWIDDIALFRLDYTNPTVFTDKYVNVLKDLKPGILRNWGAQLGSSLNNQIASSWSRKTTAYQPRDRQAVNFHYSLHEFLELAQEVGAEPWYVVPPTFSADELQNLIAYLAAPGGSHSYADIRVALGQPEPWTTIFDTIHLEYGNEMWGGNDGGDQFIGATLRGGMRLGKVANDRFGLMKASPHFDEHAFNLIIGGQASLPYRQYEIEENSTHHNSIALAPYFGVLDHYTSTEQIFYPLFARPAQDIALGLAQSDAHIDSFEPNSQLSIYEINFHTTGGEAPLPIRNAFVSSMGGAVALPLYMLTYQRDLSVINQAAFNSLQYAFRMSNGEYVRIWGLLRDIEATGRKRPTWLGLELANRAIRGDMIKTTHNGANPTWIQEPINGIVEPIEVPYIHSFAYREGETYAVVLFNLHLEQEQEVVLQLPFNPDPAAVAYGIITDNIYDNNESAPLIDIGHFNISDLEREYTLTLPPHSMGVLEWGRPGTSLFYTPPSPTPPPALTPPPTPLPGPVTYDVSMTQGQLSAGVLILIGVLGGVGYAIWRLARRAA